jgi:hypothetical protein
MDLETQKNVVAHIVAAADREAKQSHPECGLTGRLLAHDQIVGSHRLAKVEERRGRE